LQSGSVLIDQSDEWLRTTKKDIEARDETIASFQKGEKWHEELIANQKKTIASLEEAVSWRESQVEELNKGLEWFRIQLADMKERAASDERALEWRMQQVDALERERADLFAILQSTQKQLHVATEQLETIYASSSWKLISRMRHFRERLRRITGLGTSPGQP
jgi:uncharacterized protein (DUF3084 family)